MKKIMILLFGFFFITNVFAEDIKSTEKGGNWNDPNTWIGGKIPNQNSDVVIVSKVIVTQNNTCKSLRVEEIGNIKLESEEKIVLRIDGVSYFHGKWEICTNCTLNSKEIQNYTDKYELLGTIIIGE